MEFGASIFFTDYSISPAALAVALEERGFDSLWVAEHSHIPVPRRTPAPGGGELPRRYYDVMDPFVTLSVAAAVTKRLRLGTGVCLVIQRDTIQTAKLVASIDQVSNGRFLFGIGGGWNAEEIENHGTEFTSRFKKMRQQIEAMKEIWTKETSEYHGDIIDFTPMMTWPKPVQKPHPPVIVGGAFPHAAPRDPLWRWLDPDCRRRGVWRSAGISAALPPDGRRGGARSAIAAGNVGRGSRRPGYVEALPRSWRCGGELSGAARQGGRDPADLGPHGQTEASAAGLTRSGADEQDRPRRQP
jgi:probable F420-dependent oxidoreductase